MNEKTFHLHPIGSIQRSKDSVNLEIREPFRPALKQLAHFSHLMVFWWADKHDNEPEPDAAVLRAVLRGAGRNAGQAHLRRLLPL